MSTREFWISCVCFTADRYSFSPMLLFSYHQDPTESELYLSASDLQERVCFWTAGCRALLLALLLLLFNISCSSRLSSSMSIIMVLQQYRYIQKSMSVASSSVRFLSALSSTDSIAIKQKAERERESAREMVY